jgi:hypothetical protein
MPAQCWNGVRLLFGGTLAELGAGWLLGRRRPIAAARGRSVGQYCPRCTLRPSIIGRLPHGGQAHQADPGGETTKACEPVASESAAARYVMHQQLMTEAEKITGYARSQRLRRSTQIPPPAPSRSSTTTTLKLSTPGRTSRSTRAKITGWTGKTGPVKSALWSRTTTDQSHGREAKLKSAYLSNGKALSAIVELSSGTATSWGNAE